MSYSLAPLRTSRLARIAQTMALLALPMGAIAILLTRSGKVEAIHGIALVVVTAMLAAGALAIASVAAVEIWQRGTKGLAEIFRVVAISTLVLGYPAWLTVQAIRLPPLNDISTDIADAPAFSRSRAALEARGGHVPATLEPRQRVKQGNAYPGIRPILIEAEIGETFETVREAVLALKWRIVEEASPDGRNEEGRIDAIAETSLMRFASDITIRLRRQGNETRIDIRAASRLGRHDFGTNARYIRRLAEEIAAQRE